MQERNSNYLRRQAEVCIALSRATFDLALASRLRALAEDFRAKASEWDEESESLPGDRSLADFMRRA